MTNHPNKLINEKSPYLIQHSHNPVDWYPWGDEAFEKAKKENKPIFLSIGYSTCHWCHVMEKESFEDKEVAALLNNTFVSIKVDREERPDIDGIYMSVCQMMTGGGGWPLTIIMTPDKKPFFSGTYFPKRQKFNRIGMMELIPRIKEVWVNKRDDIYKSADEIVDALKKSAASTEKAALSSEVFDRAFESYKQRFDSVHGGFGNAPKFPSPHNLMFLLRYYYRTKNDSALKMVTDTLTQMRLGGIYDQIGFGFARYSTDSEWLVPHFEKMLYDQAMMSMAYTEAYQITKNELFRQTSEEILEYVLRDMTHAEGGFFSAEDADSEGEEGKFYLWTIEEIKDTLKDDAEFFIKLFNIEDDGNWVDESKGMMTGTNILHLKDTVENLQKDDQFKKTDLKEFIRRTRKILFNVREKRTHPHKDDKVLTDWNGLMISAFCKASGAFDNSDNKFAAEKAMSFIFTKLRTNDGSLIHRFRDGEAGLPAHLDDYTFIIQALLDLFELTFKTEYLKNAIMLQDILSDHYLDKINGGFFFTADNGEELISRQKELYDGAYPSGNSVMLLNLARLAKLTTRQEYDVVLEKMINHFSGQVSNYPSIFSQFLTGLDFIMNKSYEIIIAGPEKSEVVIDANKKIHNAFLPNKIFIYNNTKDEVLQLIPYLQANKAIDNKLTIYVCENYKCNLPVHTIEEALVILNDGIILDN
ncbi:MAG: thioredoxin domain-containing protein [Ignavibacteriaceae bacterium]